MAREKKLEFRDTEAQDDKPYLTKSRAQVDLERRTAEDYKPESEVGSTVTVNPNPFGQDEYVGTDPIYQNHSTDQNKPLKAEKGVEAEQLKAYKEEHEVDEADAVEDFGLGGKARRVPTGAGGRTFRTILPGQEGYDLEKAEEQNGPPLRVYNDEEEGEQEEETTEVPVPGENRGATTEPPTPPSSPGDTSDRAGTKPGNQQ